MFSAPRMMTSIDCLTDGAGKILPAVQSVGDFVDRLAWVKGMRSMAAFVSWSRRPRADAAR